MKRRGFLGMLGAALALPFGKKDNGWKDAPAEMLQWDMHGPKVVRHPPRLVDPAELRGEFRWIPGSEEHTVKGFYFAKYRSFDDAKSS